MTDGSSGIRVAVTGAFREPGAIRAFLDSNPDILASDRWLLEVRLDLLAGGVDDCIELVSTIGPKAVVSCRSRRDGGLFGGSEADRLDLLARAAAAGAGLVDVELATWLRGGGEAIRRACVGGSRIMLSVHETGASGFFEDHAVRLNSTGIDAVKLAGTTMDAGDLMNLARAGLLLTARTRCVVGMGPGAALTRMRPAAFGSNLSFAAAGPGLETAPGQPDFRALDVWRVFDSAGLEPVALVGGEQVSASPGPDILNRLFERHSIPMQYFPLPASDWDQAVKATGFFGVRRFAVTMPFKFRPIVQWPAAVMDRWVGMSGVVNTVVLPDGGQPRLCNTDAAGALEIFDRFGGIAGRDTLVLGGGATARSVAAAALTAGADVSVSTRSYAVVARDWPASLAAARFKGWERRAERGHDIVINTTPVGFDGKTDVLAGPGLRARSGVVDVVVSPEGRTPIVESAVRQRLRFASGLDFWCAQAPAQFAEFTGHSVGFPEVARVMSEAGHACIGVMAEADTILPGSGLEPVNIRVPGSKSMTQRCLVLAALGRSPSRLVHPSRSRDCVELQNALGMMGVRFGQTSDALDVYPADFPRDPGRPIPTGEGGTTIRFLAALSLICDFPLRLVPSGTMVGRPIEPLLESLSANGVEVSHGDGILTLAPGAPAGQMISVAANVSSQFASALLMAGSATSRGLSVTLLGDVVSRPYIDMTVRMIRLFGGLVEQDGSTFNVRHERNVPGLRVTVEGDASLAAFWMAASAIYGRRVDLVNPPATGASMQGDAVYPALFERLDGDGDVQLDLSDTPDLLPPLILVALFRNGRTSFGGIAHARAKESDRLHVLSDRLRQLGAEIFEEPDRLTVAPARLRGPAVLDPSGDHRMAMAFGILSLRVPGLKISDPECVDKSYPAFWQDLDMVRN